MCYLQATHMPYAPGLCPSILSCPSCRSRCPSAPPRRSTGPQGRPSPGARAARAPSGQAMSHIYRSRFRSPGPQPCGRCYPTPHYHALPPPRPATMDSWGLGSGHWGIRGPEGPSGDGAKAGPPTREFVVASSRPATSDQAKDIRHPCLEQPLADQHHRTISVVPFLPSCRPSRRRVLPTVFPPRSPAFDVTVTPTPARRCPSTT